MRTLAVVGLMVVLVTACSKSSSGSTSATTVVPATVVSTTVAPTTAGSTTGVPTTVAPTTTTAVPGCQAPQACAMAFFADWKAGDRTAASQIATAAAVTKMFGHTYATIATSSGPEDPWHFTSCNGAAGSTICQWDAQDQELQMQVNNATGGGVVEVLSVKWFEGSPLKEVN